MTGLSREGNLSSCHGKVRFDSPALAQKAAARRKDMARSHYPCPHCGGFHVGRVEGKAWRKPRKRPIIDVDWNEGDDDDDRS